MSEAMSGVELINAINAATLDSRLWLQWQRENGKTTTTEGTVIDADHDAELLEVAPTNRPDRLIVAITETEIVVRSVTAAGVASLGRLCGLRFDTPPEETTIDSVSNAPEARTSDTAPSHIGGETDG